MSFGKLYGAAENSRTTACRIVAKANDLDIELVDTKPGSPDAAYFKINALGKVPTFVGANGFVLTECIAIAVYLASQNEKTTLLGKTKQDYASILRWMSFTNQEILNPLADWFRPLLGMAPYNKQAVENSSKAALKAIDVLEKHLTNNTFLVGERLTLADTFCASLFSRAFQFVLGKDWRQANPATSRWYETVVNQAIYKAVVPNPVFVEEGLKNVPPKKEEKKAAPAKKEPEEEEKPAPKPAKHPLESLPKPSMILDDWKRKYSNEDTREAAMPWFWENYNPEDYSLWKVDYKYNDELTLTFMSNNLIGGFFARLEASRKFIFGACSVYGESNNSIIQGAFLIRGQDAVPAFDVAPDWESYSFTKLDASKPEDRQFVEDQWAQDKPIVVDGKSYECAEGKVFK
ncbi:elongation factor 1 gamma domain-containing protein [Coccidioides immitis RS]|uniref:Elongation factor 1-gamma n=2 Tax=Coccidioides TaxID=5500 RepID=J3KLX5_COCIM|nr:elongation factor 1 gamma domain-containing protein [Coccidioides immitis RS]XP_003071109.1 elongation factor 1 gamma domain-containing protein [Coccidioides posadasii C735 delta SOWgp]EAS37345.3 elongation factor 1-gamma [Coccidioides immitis RS]EER28964.1 Elongation factor 1 gamma, putative [Coccidioides posadasii C735 delta SOWgp]|eukprot:XP_003071109.1 elongation factor 1 gamma domain-containing protein [Coccidioides posadasii C735 delta SOWgp]